MVITRISGRIIRFTTTDGFVLDGFLIGRGKACIVFLHGMTGNMGMTPMKLAIAKASAKLGVSFFSINTRGHDIVSRVKKGKKYIIAGTSFERFEDSVKDIGGAISTLKKLGYKKFILIGHSTGSQKILYYQWKKKNRDVLGMVFIGPGDDYHITKKELGRKFNSAVLTAKKMMKDRQADKPLQYSWQGFSARRFLSVADTKNVEARLFNYGGPLREFSAIKLPILAVLGSKEEWLWTPAKNYAKLLAKKASSMQFDSSIIDGANHGMYGKEAELAKVVAKWTGKLL